MGRILWGLVVIVSLSGCGEKEDQLPPEENTVIESETPKIPANLRGTYAMKTGNCSSDATNLTIGSTTLVFSGNKEQCNRSYRIDSFEDDGPILTIKSNKNSVDWTITLLLASPGHVEVVSLDYELGPDPETPGKWFDGTQLYGKYAVAASSSDSPPAETVAKKDNTKIPKSLRGSYALTGNSDCAREGSTLTVSSRNVVYVSNNISTDCNRSFKIDRVEHDPPIYRFKIAGKSDYFTVLSKAGGLDVTSAPSGGYPGSFIGAEGVLKNVRESIPEVLRLVGSCQQKPRNRIEGIRACDAILWATKDHLHQIRVVIESSTDAQKTELTKLRDEIETCIKNKCSTNTETKIP